MAFEQPRMNVSLVDKLEKVWQQLTPPDRKLGPDNKGIQIPTTTVTFQKRVTRDRIPHS